MNNKDLSPHRYITPVAIKHDVYLYDDVGSSENYVDLIQSLNEATENEIFNIHISTGGGDLDGAIALIHALRTTKAITIGFADSIVASAGTIIFLACQQWVINEFSYFMFHDGSGVIAGKFNETAKQIEAIQRLYRQIADKLYRPFFSDEEIAKIMEGADLYLTAEQMGDRIAIAFPELVDEEELIPEIDDDEEEPKLLRG